MLYYKVSDAQHSDSVIYIIEKIYICTDTHILFNILFHYGLSQDIKDSSLSYTVGPCCLSKSLLLGHFLAYSLINLFNQLYSW